MTTEEIARYTAFHHVRQCEKCCGNCRWFDRQYEDSGCLQPAQREFDLYEISHAEDPWYLPESYGAYEPGIMVNEGFVCDLWERK